MAGLIHGQETDVFADAGYPRAQTVCAPGAREAVFEDVAADATEDQFGDPGVHFLTVPGVEGKEAALVVRAAPTWRLRLQCLSYMSFARRLAGQLNGRIGVESVSWATECE